MVTDTQDSPSPFPSPQLDAYEGEPMGIRPLRLGATILLFVAVADWLFFGERAGASVAAFGFILVVGLVFVRQNLVWDAAQIVGAALIGGALYESVVDLNFFNAVALGLLLASAMAYEGARRQDAGFAVWPLALLAALAGLARWPRFFSLMPLLNCPPFLKPILGQSRTRVFQVLLPGVIVAIPFVLLFSSGNAVLAAHLSTAHYVLMHWLERIEFPSFGRIAFWLFVATASLVFLFPRISPRLAKLCVKKLPTLPPGADGVVDVWRTLLILIVLNGLFFWANGLDACFLWMSVKLPANVSYSAFVHEGVFSLVTTTILSAVVLMVLFQESSRVTSLTWVKRLAVLCVLQNLFLISSVGLRLKLYIEAYDLSVLRFHVGTFLLIVALGYALMVWRIVGQKSLNWIICSNALAVFAVFYVVQFVDVKGFVARYNVDSWLNDRTKKLDLCYLERLGPTALPALAQIESLASGTPQAKQARAALADARARWSHDSRDWRSWQWRVASVQNRVFSSDESATKHGS